MGILRSSSAKTMMLTSAVALLSAAQANAADPTTRDCLDASEKSLALRRDHKLRATRVALLVCANVGCPSDIRKECAARLNEVDAAMPTVVFGAKDPRGNDLVPVVVAVDGETFGERLDGTAISLDPGVHAVTFQAAGQPVLAKQIVLREGEKDRREVVQLGEAAGPGSGAPAPDVPSGERATTLGGQRVAALVVGGLGVVGLGVGAAFGALAISKHGQAKNACPNTACPTQAGVNLWNTARLDGNVSTAALVAGGVLLAGGVVVFATGEPPAKPRSALTVGPRAITWKGVW